LSAFAQGATATRLEQLNCRVVRCRRCPRLLDWCARVATEKRAAYSHEPYWGRPVSSFGDPEASILIVGLAPGAHGANRTGRMFTGDRSGDWLFRALHRAGLASQADSRRVNDGLSLRGVYITAAVRCAPPKNRPTPTERDRCRPFLEEELDILVNTRVIVALGGLVFSQLLKIFRGRGEVIPLPSPKFSHGVEVQLERAIILGSYHPSQQNTFTGKLTEPMFDAIWERARHLTVRLE
jgi:uracil-DNA glycosylase family 4